MANHHQRKSAKAIIPNRFRPDTPQSRPMRRILAEWIGKLADRLLHFQSQLRFGFIRMLSTTVAETIEDQFHRHRNNPDRRDAYEPEYLDDDSYHDDDYYQPRSAPHLASSSPA
jgi:hypothetical protein